MRRVLILCLFIVACQNQETNERLARVQKKLDEIQKNPPVEKIIAPADPTASATLAAAPTPTPAEPAPFVNPPLSQRQIQIGAGVAELGVRRGIAVYVPKEGNPQFGVVYQHVPQAVLYKWNPEWKSYLSVCEVESILDHEHLVDINAARMAKLQSQLSFVFDPPPLPPFTHEEVDKLPPVPQVRPALADTYLDPDVVELCVRDGRCTYVATKDDPKGGVVFEDHVEVLLCRWEAKQKWFHAIANIDFVRGRDGKIVFSKERMDYLRARLEAP